MNIPAPASWLTAVENKGCGVIKERKVRDTMQGLSTCTLSPNQVEVKESVAELIATGLRRRDGIALAAWQEVSLIYIQNTWRLILISSSYKACGGTLSVDEFFERGKIYGLEKKGENIALSDENVSILDSILPYLFNVIDDLKVIRQ